MIFNVVLASVLAFVVIAMVSKKRVDPATGQVKSSILGFSGFDDVLGIND